MQNNTITSSIIDRLHRSISHRPANIIYLETGSLFDKILCENLNHNIFIHKNINDINFDITTYDLCISSDPVYYSQNQNLINALHIPSIVMIHSHPAKSIKKEDKFLIGRYLTNTTKIFFDVEISENWNIGHQYIIDYGFSDLQNLVPSEKTNRVVVLNSNKSRGISLLFQSIKTNYNDAVMLSYDQYDSVQDIIKEISKYKVAVSIDHPYDSALCSLAGCETISPYKNKHLNIHTVSDFATIHDKIKECLSAPNQYPYNVLADTSTMVNNINSIIKNKRNTI